MSKYLAFFAGCAMVLGHLGAKAQAPEPKNSISLDIPVVGYTVPAQNFSVSVNHTVYSGRQADLSVSVGINHSQNKNSFYSQFEVFNKNRDISLGFQGGFNSWEKPEDSESVQKGKLERHGMVNAFLRSRLFQENKMSLYLKAGVAASFNGKMMPTLGISTTFGKK